MEVVDNRRLLFGVSFVHAEEERPSGLAQQPHQLEIRPGEFGAAVDDHDNRGGFVERNPRLAKNLRRNEVLIFGKDAAGVDDADAASTPLRIAIEAVAGNAGLVADACSPGSHNAVEQRGLSYVRSAHDGERRNAGRGGSESAGRVVSGLSQSERDQCRQPGVFIIETPVALSSQPVSPPTPKRSSPVGKDASLYQFFAPGGALASTHPVYEFRRGQLQMAQAVEQALEEKRHLIVEAGTGTGKTLAYLMPVIRSGKRVIISTGTKNLQEQLFYKDIPFLERALYGDHVGTAASAVQPSRGPGRFSVCYMKGRNNYLCREKHYHLTAQPV